MNVNLTPELEKFVHSKVASGRYNSASEVVRESLRLLEEWDRVKLSRYDELKREVAVGLKQIEEGKVKPFDLERIKDRVRREAAKKKKA
jgi:antitoxin ParD1/3/4